jgi:hypothetical protein
MAPMRLLSCLLGTAVRSDHPAVPAQAAYLPSHLKSRLRRLAHRARIGCPEFVKVTGSVWGSYSK